MKTKQWFIDRIGKKIYRNSNGCDCEVCKNIGVHGVIVSNELHAIYLFDIQNAYNEEGINLNYRDETKTD